MKLSYPKLIIIIIAILLLGILIFIPIRNTAKRNYRITDELTSIAESYGLKDVKITIGGKLPNYSFYEVTVDFSNFKSLSYNQMYYLSDSMMYVDDAFVTEFTSNDSCF